MHHVTQAGGCKGSHKWVYVIKMNKKQQRKLPTYSSAKKTGTDWLANPQPSPKISLPAISIGVLSANTFNIDPQRYRIAPKHMLDFRPHFSVIYDAGNDESIPAKKNEEVNRDNSYHSLSLKIQLPFYIKIK